MRLAWLPEAAAAALGGDLDKAQFPEVYRADALGQKLLGPTP